MNDSFYDVSQIQQGIQECAQASATQLLNFFGITKTIDEVKNEVPVYVNDLGKPLGTSIGHMAAYFVQQGFTTTIHTTDIQIFDRSWTNKSNEELISLLSGRKQFIKHPVYTAEVFDVIFDGYISFLKQGGQIVFPIIDETYIVNLLESGPLFAVLSYNFLNSVAKYKFDSKENSYNQDSVEGNPSTHSVVVAGFKEHKFYIIDPDLSFGGKKWIDANLFIASLYAAETDFDSLIISLKKIE